MTDKDETVGIRAAYPGQRLVELNTKRAGQTMSSAEFRAITKSEFSTLGRADKARTLARMTDEQRDSFFARLSGG